MLIASVPLYIEEEIKAIRSGYSESVCLCDLKKRKRGEHKSSKKGKLKGKLVVPRLRQKKEEVSKAGNLKNSNNIKSKVSIAKRGIQYGNELRHSYREHNYQKRNLIAQSKLLSHRSSIIWNFKSLTKTCSTREIKKKWFHPDLPSVRLCRFAPEQYKTSALAVNLVTSWNYYWTKLSYLSISHCVEVLNSSQLISYQLILTSHSYTQPCTMV